MKLTIQNIDKIKGQRINRYWDVTDVEVGNIFYQFLCQNHLDGSNRTVMLIREPNTINNQFHFQRRDTKHSVPYDINEIEHFDTFLRVLEYELDYGYKR